MTEFDNAAGRLCDRDTCSLPRTADRSRPRSGSPSAHKGCPRAPQQIPSTTAKDADRSGRWGRARQILWQTAFCGEIHA